MCIVYQLMHSAVAISQVSMYMVGLVEFMACQLEMICTTVSEVINQIFHSSS